jgi:hypothetical protein
MLQCRTKKIITQVNLPGVIRGSGAGRLRSTGISVLAFLPQFYWEGRRQGTDDCCWPEVVRSNRIGGWRGLWSE